MAKSAGEFLSLQALADRNYSPLAYRYLCLSAHYRTQLNFTWGSLDGASIALDRIRRSIFAARSGDVVALPDPDAVEQFGKAINDDLNMPRALALAWEVLRGGLEPSVMRATILKFDSVFGLGLERWIPKQELPPECVTALAEARLAARRAKNWPEADRLRAELHAAGWEAEDHGDRFVLKKLPGGSS